MHQVIVTKTINSLTTKIITMSKEGKGRIVKLSSARTRFVSVPADVAGDDRFPFETGERVTVRIEEGKRRLVVEKVEYDSRRG